MKKILFVLLIFVSVNSVSAKSGRGVDKLIAGLYDESWSVRLQSVLDLGKNNDSRAIKPLVQTLSDDNIHVRKYTAKVLIRIGKPAYGRLTISIRDVDWFVRKESVYALSEIDGVRALSLLVNALRDRDERVVNEAKKALIKIGKPAVKPVLALLKDLDGDVKRNAGYVLSKIGKPAVKPLIKTLKKKDCYVVVEAIWALGEISDNRAVKPLIRILKNKNSLIRWEAISALGKLGDMKAIKYIKPRLKDKDDHVRTIAREVTDRLMRSAKKEVSIAASNNW